MATRAQADLVECVHELRTQMFKRGQHGLRLLGLSFKVNDHTGTGYFDFDETEAILGKAGLFLKRQDLTRLYRYFDRDRHERMYYPELISALQGNLSARRSGMIEQVWQQLDTNFQNNGLVDISYIFSQYNARRHPQVLSGERKAKDIEIDFQSAMEGAGGNNNGLVIKTEFMEYYLSISATIPFDDDYFVHYMENVWNCKENGNAASFSSNHIPRTLLRRIEHVLREKIRQKTVPTKSELESLRLTFRHFDNDGAGMITYKEFLSALERFGIILEEKVTRALFDEFDPNHIGRINYAEFAAALYENELLAIAYTNRSKTQTLAAAANNTSRREYIDTSKLLISAPANGNSATFASTVIQPVAGAGAPVAANNGDLGRTRGIGAATPTVIFVLSVPGSGVEEQIGNIVKEFTFVYISITDLLQHEQTDRNSQYYELINNYLREQKSIPVEIIVTLLQRAISKHVLNGHLYFLIDFPLNIEQKQGWQQLVASGSIDIPFVLFFDAPQDEIEKRCRDPIQLRSLREEFRFFTTQTLPVVEEYGREGKLRVIDATQPPQQVYQDVRNMIAQL